MKQVPFATAAWLHGEIRQELDAAYQRVLDNG